MGSISVIEHLHCLLSKQCTLSINLYDIKNIPREEKSWERR